MNQANRGRRVRAIIMAVLALALALWFSGAMGVLLSRFIAGVILPVSFGGELTLTGLVKAGDPGTVPGLVVGVSPVLVQRALLEASPWFRFMPPGFVRTGLRLSGSWRIPSKFGKEIDIPFVVLVDRGTFSRPAIRLVSPIEPVNQILKVEGTESLRTEEEWFLGKYELVYTIELEELRLYSTDRRSGEGAGSASFAFEANGRIRIRFIDDLVEARVSGRVRELRGRLDVKSKPADGGLSVSYDVDIERLEINVNNMAQFGDRMLSDKLRHSMEKSMNRRKKKERFARKRFPAWIPLDTAVDVRLTRSGS